jgi:hypothetical protein
MKLSSETVEVLKNFSTINQNLLIKEGSDIATMSAMKNIVAKATVTEKFPREFAIYDLNEFLALLSLYESPDLDFQDKRVVLSENGRSSRYYYANKNNVTTPQKDITMPDCEVKFAITDKILADIQRGASIIGAPDLVLEDSKLKATNRKSDEANDYEMPVDIETVDATYQFWFKVDNLKIMPGSYDVQISSKNISYFKNSKIAIEYFIALEPSSKFTPNV